jgi:uncharacterized damage-inducible protein DinB
VDLSSRIRELLKYTLWADRKLLKAAAGVEPEHLIRPAGASFGTMLGTLAHILVAERLWLSRFVGNPLAILPDTDEYPDFTSLQTGFEELWPELEFYLASLAPGQLDGVLEWTNSQGETHRRLLWQAVVHMVNHSSYHRGQVVLLLRQLGYEPPATDMIYFFKAPAT